MFIGTRSDFREEVATSVHSVASGARVSAAEPVGNALSRSKVDQKRLSIAGLGIPYLFSLCQCFVVVLASILASFIYQEAFLGQSGILTVSAPVGLVAGILFAGAMHIVDAANPHRKLNGLSALRDLSAVWAGVILLITFLAFSLKAGETLSRGTIFVFVAAGYISLVLTRSFTPQLMAASVKLANGRGHHVLVVGAHGFSAGRILTDELAHSGHINMSYLEVDVTCDDTKWRAELPVLLGKIFSVARDYGRGPSRKGVQHALLSARRKLEHHTESERTRSACAFRPPLAYRRQMTPSCLPTFSKVLSAKSICASVSVAQAWMRSRAVPSGTTG